mgnify:CR=1 FL=1
MENTRNIYDVLDSSDIETIEERIFTAKEYDEEPWQIWEWVCNGNISSEGEMALNDDDDIQIIGEWMESLYKVAGLE